MVCRRIHAYAGPRSVRGWCRASARPVVGSTLLSLDRLPAGDGGCRIGDREAQDRGSPARGQSPIPRGRGRLTWSLRSSLVCSRRSPSSSPRVSIAGLSVAILLRIALVSVALAAGCLYGCGRRVVLVREDSPVRIGPGAKARLYTLDGSTGEWSLSENAAELPEGWYLVSPMWLDEEDRKP